MYSEYLAEVIEENATKYKSYYDQMIEACTQTNPTTLTELIEAEEKLRAMIVSLAKAAPKQAEVDIPAYIKSIFEPKIVKYNNALAALEESHAEALKGIADTAKQDKDKLQTEHDDKVKAAEEAAVAGIKPLIEKHDKLLTYKDKIEYVCGRYAISPADTDISTDVTQKEFEALLDASIQGCEQMMKQASGKGNALALLYKPLEWDDWKFKLLALVGFSIAFHWVGGIFALVFFGFMIYNTVGVYRKLDKLKIASALMYTNDFDKFIKRDAVLAIPDVDVTTIDEATKDKIAAENAAYTVELEKLKAEDPNEELSAALQECNKNIDAISAEIQASYNELKKLYISTLNGAKEKFAATSKRKQEEIAKLKNLGDGMLDEEPHTYPSNKYILSLAKGTVPMRVEVPVHNYHFNSEAPGMLDFLKLMLCNILLDFKEKRFTVIIVDPEGLAKDFSEFFSNDKITHDYILLDQSTCDNAFSKLKPKVTQNIRICGNKSIDEANHDFEDKGMVTMDNYLVICFSGQGDYFQKPDVQQFITTSFKYGVRVWDYSPTPINGIINFEKPFDKLTIETPMTYNFNLGLKCTNTYAEAVTNSKDGSIDYFSSIQEKYIPRDKWGTWSTRTGIELNFGLADGDPSKGYPMTLGDANVHLLMAGQSGAGKSAAINQMLLSLLTKYSPNELMLVMVDFKNVEFSTFTVLDEKSGDRLSIIPHARIMAGTKDGEYALSIFDFLIAEMERRQKLLGAVNQKKLEDYNNLMEEQGAPMKKLPRILLLIDEFQVMFTEVDRKIVDIIQDRIRSLAKLARAFGCHMWFTSQSMSGTMSQDVKGNFSMRAALRCTRDVSTEIIGNPAAGEIKAKFGYLITNDSTGQDPTRNTTWRVPFVSTKNILKTINEAAELYKSQGMTGYKAIFYDEEQMYPDKRLFDFYEQYKDNEKVQNKHLIVLGERTNFSTNPAPVNFYLEKGDNQNLMIGAMEDSDMLNMCRTIMDNIEAHKLKYIISCADEDAFQLLELDTRLQGQFLKWAPPNVPFEDWVDGDQSPIAKIIDNRLAKSDGEYEPLYVILYNWDKYPGFGVNINDKKADSFKELMRVGPTVDVHFVLICRTKGDLKPSVYTLFQHRIGCLMDESTSYKILDSTKGNKLPNKGGYAIYKRGNSESKFKIYQHVFARKLADKELKL